MKIQKAKKLLLPLLTALALFTASCSMTGDKVPAEDLSTSAAAVLPRPTMPSRQSWSGKTVTTTPSLSLPTILS